jgi:hypothetical protein
MKRESKNGAFITTCICHGCNWAGLSSDWSGAAFVGTSYQHYARWMVGNATGVAALTIDTRPPNGGGAITDGKCLKF